MDRLRREADRVLLGHRELVEAAAFASGRRAVERAPSRAPLRRTAAPARSSRRRPASRAAAGRRESPIERRVRRSALSAPGRDAEEADLRLRRGVATAGERRDRDRPGEHGGVVDRRRRARGRRPATTTRGAARRRAPSVAAGPRMMRRAWRASIQSKDRSVDRRTFLRARARRGRPPGRWRRRSVSWPTRPPTRSQSATVATRVPRAGVGGRGRPNILVILVDQLRFPAVDRRRARRAWACRPTSRSLSRRGGLVLPALHRLERLHPRALGAADRPLHPSDGLHDHRRQHARPWLPDVGHDASRARLPHPLVRQVAPHPPRQLVDERHGRTCARALRVRRRHLPLARRRPRAGMAPRPAHRRAVRRVVRPGGRRRAVVHDRLVRQPARHRVVVRVERTRPGRGERRERRAGAATELRDARSC